MFYYIENDQFSFTHRINKYKIIYPSKNYMLINTELNTKKSLINGNGKITISSYEKNDETLISNIEYILLDDNGNVLNKQIVNDSEKLSFIDLDEDKKYKIIVKDKSKKYISKYIDEIVPSYEILDKINIIKIYESKTIDNYLYIFKVEHIGDLVVTLSNNISGLTLEELQNDLYKVNGNYENGMSFTIITDDYVDGVVYRKERVIEP